MIIIGGQGPQRWHDYHSERVIIDLLLLGTPIVDIAHSTGAEEETIRFRLRELVGQLAHHYFEDLTREGWLSGILTDDVTGIWTRRYGFIRLQQVIKAATRYNQTLSVVFLDLDGFKLVNDQHGHAAGDRLLRQAATLWRTKIRDSDFICRWGGDEFLIVLPCASYEAAAAFAERLKAETALDLAFSVGVAEWHIGELPEALIHRADQAMYADKRSRQVPGRHDPKKSPSAAKPRVIECNQERRSTNVQP